MAGTFTNLVYHFVFSTKDRQPLITLTLRPELYNYMGGILRNHDATLLDIGGTADHVHVVVKLRPDMSPSEMVRLLKANSSK